MTEIENIIMALDLQPHPEGGYFREMYRSSGIISKNNLEATFSGDRNYSTAIYFLLTSDTFSAFHKINQDEIKLLWKTDARSHHVEMEGNHPVYKGSTDLH